MKKPVRHPRPMDAVEILRQDHLRLSQLFEDYFAAQENRRYDLIPYICEGARRHMALDSEIFFPCLAQAVGDEHLASSAVAECTAVNDFVDELLHPDPGDFNLTERVFGLATLMLRHVSASERDDGAFAKALNSTMDGAVVGALLRRRQREWMLRTLWPGA